MACVGKEKIKRLSIGTPGLTDDEVRVKKKNIPNNRLKGISDPNGVRNRRTNLSWILDYDQVTFADSTPT